MVGLTTYTTAQMIGVINGLQIPSNFLLDLYFPNMINFQTEEVFFDKVSPNRKLAPFVSPLVEGQAQVARGFNTATFKPAYVKMKETYDINRPLKRSAGEAFGGTLSPGARRDAIVSAMLMEHINNIRRRKSWMCAQLLQTGTFTVSGPGFEPQLIDLNRDAALTVTLTGAARWGEAGVSVIDNLNTWIALVQEKGDGAVATKVTMDPLAWNLARTDADFRESLDNRRQETGAAEFGAISTGNEKARKVGTIGDIEIWVFNDTYVDDAGDTQKFLPDYTVILGGPDAEGVQLQGAIKDPRAGFAALEFYPTNWITEDPTAEWFMTQSAPLVVAGRINGTLAATVHDGV